MNTGSYKTVHTVVITETCQGRFFIESRDVPPALIYPHSAQEHVIHLNCPQCFQAHGERTEKALFACYLMGL